ncbi:hypothetical protein KY385_03990 [Candidatus Parcubacteria bacterium]|nr:hypothetical protein [Candidatus Parcubacteria bacterium]
MPKDKTDAAADIKIGDKKPEPRKEVFDVAKPGSTPATPTSRPIIVGHQSALRKDPFLANGETDASVPKLTKQRKITPLVSEGKAKEVPADNSEEKTDTSPEEKADEETPGTNDSNAAIDALAGEVDAKAQAKERSKAEKEQDEKIQALLDAKKYSLSITEGGKKAASERIATWLLIFMLVAASVVWLAIDAGYLDAGFDLPYDFINN